MSITTTGRPAYVVGLLTERAASGPGALDGWGFDCTCGGGMSASLKGMAAGFRREHITWHARRGDGVVEVVKLAA